MPGAHTPRSQRSTGPDDPARTGASRRPDGPADRPALPVQRSGRGAHPSRVGWWQPPKSRGGPTPEETSPRHRVPDATEVLSRAEAPGRTSRVRRRGAGGTRRSQHRKPLTPVELRARRRRRIRTAVLGSFAAALLGPVVAFALGYLFFAVPSPDDAVNNQVALVSFADGSQLTRLVPDQGNRIKVPLAQVPEPVRNAVLAAEDRSFYSNPGFDLTGIARAAWNQLGGGSGGGSTVTQQFVKKALVGDEQTLWRKYKEVVLAVKISQERTKDEILADYLNTIYFGRGAYGIQSAAQAYFGKDVEELVATEGAMLAGLIQSPSRWDPAVSPERSVQRWNFVLDGMASQGWLSPEARSSAQFPATVPRRSAAGGVPGDDRGHIVTAVTNELSELGISEQDLAQEGLRITTTIDPVRQQQAVDAVHEALDRQPGNLRSATVAIDPATGGVLAYYGGDNGLGLDYARVQRLAGSTFKPFVVLAALLQDPPVGLGEVYDGAAVPGLRNAEGSDCDECDIKQAMTVSNNVVFNTLARQVGPGAVAAAARAAGITSPLEDPNEGIALGNKEVSTFELASAYATLAAGGVWHQPHLVTSVVTAEGRVLYEASTDGEQRFPERVARNVTEAMLDVAEHDGLALPDGQPVAAKTGTVESRFEGENNDAWMAGFTPTLASAVWIGTDMNSPIRTARGTPISGSSLPGDVWQEFMTEAHEDEPVRSFVPFRPIGEEPSNLPPGAEATPTPPPPPPPAATPTPGPDGQFPPDPRAVGREPGTSASPGPDGRTSSSPSPSSARGLLGAPDRSATARATPARDCSVAPCG